MTDTCSKEVAKEFALQRLRLTPQSLGRCREDVPSVVRAIGGLQYGGHKIELFSRFEDFKPEWFDWWYENHALIEGHVLRGALRIINVDEYVYYFKATRSVARRRTYQTCPESLAGTHFIALDLIGKYGPLTSSAFKELLVKKQPRLQNMARRLLYDLYNYGKVVRMGRRKQRPLYHTVDKASIELDISQIGEKEAKEWLFLKCLSIYGPFTLRDITHWVGWNITETKEILDSLTAKKKVTRIRMEDEADTNYVRVEDLPRLDSLRNSLPQHSFVRVLFNDDALLLGYYKRLKDYFGYHWEYPQLSEGIVWRTAILRGRQLIGEAIVDMYAKSPLFKVKKLRLRKEFATSTLLSQLEDEFAKHAKFQNKTLEMTRPEFM